MCELKINIFHTFSSCVKEKNNQLELINARTRKKTPTKKLSKEPVVELGCDDTSLSHFNRWSRPPGSDTNLENSVALNLARLEGISP